MTESAVARFVREVTVEPEHIQRARQHALELGASPVSAVVGAQCAVAAAATSAKTMIEIGTGAGVSGLWLLHGAPGAVLTTIDKEPEHLAAAREAFSAAHVPASRVRYITGRASDVLPRMNEGAYDVVLVDGDPATALDDVAHALRLARPGGLVLVPRVLQGGRVADPVARDAQTSDFRTLVTETLATAGVVASLATAGEGLLQIVVGR
ncbi:O-methyltransferase [Microbacterium indicum]|uniref:O-methyltransferase n=1 Tax=Microbacterium indicum TaxID=358100 RepID=UPI000490410C|nr:class I SAM-dependent methyltransferase [Microbacterium indicum]